MLLKNAYLCQFKNKKFQPKFADVTIEDGKIIDIKEKSYEKFLEKRIGEDEPDNDSLSEYDANGRIVMPPFVNFHEHIYSRLSKGLPVTGDLSSFIHVLENLWWKLDRALLEKAIVASAQIAALEAIKNGVGTLFDHHSSPEFVSGSLNLIKNELKNRGLKAVLSYEVSDRNGMENMKKSVEENLNFSRFRNSDRFKAQFGLHALFTLSDETLQLVQKKTSEESPGYHIHVAEGKYDVEFNKENYGLSLIDRMEKYNLLNDKTFVVHGNHLTKSELDRIAEYKAKPDSQSGF